MIPMLLAAILALSTVTIRNTTTCNVWATVTQDGVTVGTVFVPAGRSEVITNVALSAAPLTVTAEPTGCAESWKARRVERAPFTETVRLVVERPTPSMERVR